MKPSSIQVLTGVAVVAFILGLVLFRHAGVGILMLAALLYLCAIMIFIAIAIAHPRLPRHPPVKDIAATLERQNLLTSTTYHAHRAFRVGEHHGEGPHYFLELETGGILHLSGPYLYEYEPGQNSLRHFPCTEFSVRTHRELGYVIDIICGGLIIEPEVEAPPYTSRDFQARRVPDDCAVLQNISFDQLIFERTEPKARFR